MYTWKDNRTNALFRKSEISFTCSSHIIMGPVLPPPPLRLLYPQFTSFPSQVHSRHLSFPTVTLCNVNMFRMNNASRLKQGLQWTVERVDHLDPDPFGGGARGHREGRSGDDPRGLHNVSVKQAEAELSVMEKDSLAMIKVGSAVR